MGNTINCGGCIIPQIKKQEVSVDKDETQNIQILMNINENRDRNNHTEKLLSSSLSPVNCNDTKDDKNIIVLKSMNNEEKEKIAKII